MKEIRLDLHLKHKISWSLILTIPLNQSTKNKNKKLLLNHFFGVDFVCFGKRVVGPFIVFREKEQGFSHAM